MAIVLLLRSGATGENAELVAVEVMGKRPLLTAEGVCTF